MVVSRLLAALLVLGHGHVDARPTRRLRELLLQRLETLEDMLGLERFDNTFEKRLEEFGKPSEANPAYLDTLLGQVQAKVPNMLTSGSTVYMGFWSGGVLEGAGPPFDFANNFKPNQGPCKELLAKLAPVGGAAGGSFSMWDESAIPSSVESDRLPDYQKMEVSEGWYHRKSECPGDGPEKDACMEKSDEEADLLWGIYSQRYTELATKIKEKTGQKVKAIVMAIGARKSRVYRMWEEPTLQQLKADGVVDIYYAKSQDASSLSDLVPDTDAAVPGLLCEDDEAYVKGKGCTKTAAETVETTDDKPQTQRKRRNSSLVKLKAMGLVQKYTAGG